MLLSTLFIDCDWVRFNLWNMKLFIVLVVCASFCVSFGQKARFDNYHVYSIQIENAEQLEVLRGLESNRDGLMFIEAPIAVESVAEILVPPHKLADIDELFQKFDIKTEIKIDDFQRFVRLDQI